MQPPSVFTDAVITGLRTGDADLDGDGLITLDELYDYVFDRVRALNPRQVPRDGSTSRATWCWPPACSVLGLVRSSRDRSLPRC